MDEGFFQQLVDRHYADLYRFALSLARNPADASDLVQQTYETYARKGDQIRDVAKAKQWLFTTLYRGFTAAYRRGKKNLSLDDMATPLPEESVASQAVTSLEYKEIRNALQSLDDRHRAVLTLHYLDDLSYREIADVLDIPIGTVMSRLSRGKAMLREKMQRLTNEHGINITPIDSYQQDGKENG